MARARNIKPGFFKNYDLADLGPHAQILFAGLWCLADKEGRLEDKPRLIKAEIFPYYEVDVNGELTKLARLTFIYRYQAEGMDLIEIPNFTEHQSPHHTEKASKLPARSGHYQDKPLDMDTPEIHGGLTVDSRNSNGGNPPDSLIPDSLIPDSLIPDSLIPDSGLMNTAPASPKQRKQTKTTLPADFSISERVRKWAREKGFSRLETHFENFVSACRAKGYTYVDWDEGFMGAIRNDWAKVNQPQPIKSGQHVSQAQLSAANEEAKRLLFGNRNGEVIDV